MVAPAAITAWYNNQKSVWMDTWSFKSISHTHTHIHTVIDESRRTAAADWQWLSSCDSRWWQPFKRMIRKKQRKLIELLVVGVEGYWDQTCLCWTTKGGDH